MSVPDTTEDIVGVFLARYGEWAELETRFIADNLADGARVADIGAFVGSFGIGLSQKKSLGFTCFIEANGEVLDFLRMNVERNCRSASKVVPALICPADYKPAPPHRIGDNQGSTSYAQSSIDQDDILLPNERMDFSSLWNEHGPFDLIKLDVEGMELPILLDARDHVLNGRTAIWAECNDDIKSLQVAELLLSYGLKVYYYAFSSFNPDNFAGDPEPYFPYAYEAGLFATRAEPVFDDALRSSGCLFTEIKDIETLRHAMWRTPRWVPGPLVADQAQEVIALAIHALRGERYRDYLTLDENVIADQDEWSPVADLMDRISQLEHQLSQLNDQKSKLEEKLGQQIDLIRWTEALARDRLLVLRSEAKRRSEIEREYQLLITSYSWRATKPLRAILRKFPTLRDYLIIFARSLRSMTRRR
jgi:FkbM family methyltransferase